MEVCYLDGNPPNPLSILSRIETDRGRDSDPQLLVEDPEGEQRLAWGLLSPSWTKPGIHTGHSLPSRPLNLILSRVFWGIALASLQASGVHASSSSLPLPGVHPSSYCVCGE